MFEQKLKDDPKSADELRDMLQKWEDNDKETIALWKKMNDWVLRGFDVTYARFGSEFDVTFLESAIYKKAGGIVEEGLKKGVFGRDENGAIVARLKKYGLPDKVVLRADGTSIYATNDLALTKQKFEKFHLDENVWVVASEQNLYFKQLFKIFELLGYKWAKNCHHLSYGMVFLPEGRLKSREGKIIDADDLMDDMQKSAADEIKKRSPEISEKELNCRAKEIALCAIKFFMLKTDSGKDITFDVKSSLSFEGESGPYLQYTYARAKSILRKARIPEKADFSMLNSEIEKELVMLLARYESAVDKSLEQYSPHVLCQYLLKLAETFNTFYHNTPVLKAEKAKMDARILLVAGVAQTLKNGLELLDISTVEEM
jgi:arginyl-tRNA synthetase